MEKTDGKRPLRRSRQERVDSVRRDLTKIDATPDLR